MCDFVSSFAPVPFIVFCSNWIFGSGTQCLLAHKAFVFRVEEMDLEDSREIRVNSGQVIGLIMLLLAMLPRDIRSDLVDRLHRMTTQEMVDWYRTSTAASSERAGNSTVDPTSEGENARVCSTSYSWRTYLWGRNVWAFWGWKKLGVHRRALVDSFWIWVFDLNVDVKGKRIHLHLNWDRFFELFQLETCFLHICYSFLNCQE